MKIALCVICKDEEKCIARCINSVKQVVDEIVVVDTGSTDRTLEIARELGADVYEIEWENDFAKARNYALAQCKSDWIIFLDADEYFTEQSTQYIKNAIIEANKHKADYIVIEMFNLKEQGVDTSFKTIRIIKHDKMIRYKGRIHEKVVKLKGELKGADASNLLKVYHDGYVQSVVNEKNKTDRNLSMLLRELEENPHNSDIHFYIMQEYYGNKKFEEAWHHGVEAIKYKNQTISGMYDLIYEHFLEICIIQERSLKETTAIYKEAIAKSADYPDFEAQYARYLCAQGQIEEGIKHFELCLAKMESYKGTTLSMVINKPLEMWNIVSNLYIQTNQGAKAIPLLVNILKVDPYQAKALYNLISVVQEQEETNALGGFLMKLYNMAQIKDQIVLLTVCQTLKNKALYDYFWVRANKEVQAKMPQW